MLILLAPKRLFASNPEKSALNLAGQDGGIHSPLSIPEWRVLDQIAWMKGSALLPRGVEELPGHVAHKLKLNFPGKRARTQPAG